MDSLCYVQREVRDQQAFGFKYHDDPVHLRFSCIYSPSVRKCLKLRCVMPSES